MTLTELDSPLRRMVETTPTDYWNDSCAVAELDYAVARGGTGATSNPVIVGEVMKKERDHWVPRVRELAIEQPDLVRGRAHLGADRGDGRPRGRRPRPGLRARGPAQGPAVAADEPGQLPRPRADGRAGVHFSTLAPNIQVKFPTHGRRASRRSRRRRPAASSSTSRSCSRSPRRSQRQRPSSADWRRYEAAGGDTADFSPVCSLMVGRLDDWVKVLVDRDNIALDPDAANWAGIAVFKRAYGIYRERGYRTRLLAAAYRHGCTGLSSSAATSCSRCLTPGRSRFDGSGIDPAPRIDERVDPAIVDDLLTRVPDFERAYEPDGTRDRRVRRLRRDGSDVARVRAGVPRPPGRRPRHRPAQPGRPRRLTGATLGRAPTGR